MSPEKKNDNANDAINLHVYRRNGQFFVNPMAISVRSFKALESGLVVKDGKNGLLEALETAEQLARDLT